MRRCELLSSNGRRISRPMLSPKGSTCLLQRRHSMHRLKAAGWKQLRNVGQRLDRELKAEETSRLKQQKLSSLASRVLRPCGGLESSREANAQRKRESGRASCWTSELEPKENPWTSRASSIPTRMTIPPEHRDQTQRPRTTTEAATFCLSQQASAKAVEQKEAEGRRKWTDASFKNQIIIWIHSN